MRTLPIRSMPGRDDLAAYRPAAKAASRRKERYSTLVLGVCVLLFVLAISRYDATAYAFRQTEEVDLLSWFWKARWLDTFGFFDFAVTILFIGVLSNRLLRRSLELARFDRVLITLGLLVAASFVISVAFPGEDDINRELLYQLRNYLYFAASYFICSRLSWSERHRKLLAKVLVISTLALLSISFWERIVAPENSFIMKYGQSVSLKDIADYPYVLWCELWVLALLFGGALRNWWHRLLAVSVVVYSLVDTFGGTGKALIVLYPLVLIYLGWWYRITRRSWFMLASPFVVVFLIVGGSYVLEQISVADSDSQIQVYSALLNPVNDPSTATRIVESINFFENLYERNAFLQGIGLGGRWYEFTPQPEDPGAYPLLERLAGSHLGVHVPLLRLIFDFGFIGFVIFTVLILKCYKEIRVILRSERAQPAMKAFIHASWLVIVFVVFINNLAVPKMSLLAGVLFGVLAALVEYDRKSTPRHIAWTP